MNLRYGLGKHDWSGLLISDLNLIEAPVDYILVAVFGCESFQIEEARGLERHGVLQLANLKLDRSAVQMFTCVARVCAQKANATDIIRDN